MSFSPFSRFVPSRFSLSNVLAKVSMKTGWGDRASKTESGAAKADEARPEARADSAPVDSRPIYWYSYGSMVGVASVNRRGMHRYYRREDLSECVLNGYVRELAGVWKARRFFSIRPRAGSSVCGCLFPVDPWDVAAIKRSEGDDLIYEYVDVRDQLADVTIDLPANARVLTCVVKKPSFRCAVPAYYIDICAEGLRERSPEFRRRFGPISEYLKQWRLTP